MRWLIRTLIFWAITAPLFYAFGMPFLLDKLQDKARAQSYSQCQQQLTSEGLIGTPTAILKADEGDHYCQCVSEAVTVIRADLPELVQKKTPARLTADMKPKVEACNQALKDHISGILNNAPAPKVEKQPDGTEIIHFN